MHEGTIDRVGKQGTHTAVKRFLGVISLLPFADSLIHALCPLVPSPPPVPVSIEVSDGAITTPQGWQPQWPNPANKKQMPLARPVWHSG